MTAKEFQQKFGRGLPGTEDTVKKPSIQRPAADAGPNKTERLWMERLKHLRPQGCRVEYENLTLKIPGGKYTPDVVVLWPDGRIECWEVKGSYIHNERSISAFKAAVETYPTFGWGFAQLKKTEWCVSNFTHLPDLTLSTPS